MGATCLVNVIVPGAAAGLAPSSVAAERNAAARPNAPTAASFMVCPYLTTTLTNPFVQQHCAWPAPVTPDASLARTRTRYSPGALNVACVVASPPVTLTRADAGLNVTPPGPTGD